MENVFLTIVIHPVTLHNGKEAKGCVGKEEVEEGVDKSQSTVERRVE